MKKPLKRCCNGCDAPPQPPSWVLCKSCLEALDKKMTGLAAHVALGKEILAEREALLWEADYALGVKLGVPDPDAFASLASGVPAAAASKGGKP